MKRSGVKELSMDKTLGYVIGVLILSLIGYGRYYAWRYGKTLLDLEKTQDDVASGVLKHQIEEDKKNAEELDKERLKAKEEYEKTT